jgi:orotate phosphoribosyltransferase
VHLVEEFPMTVTGKVRKVEMREAAVKLIRAQKGNVVGCSFIIDLPELGGRKRLEALDVKVLALCEFEGH